MEKRGRTGGDTRVKSIKKSDSDEQKKFVSYS